MQNQNETNEINEWQKFVVVGKKFRKNVFSTGNYVYQKNGSFSLDFAFNSVVRTKELKPKK